MTHALIVKPFAQLEFDEAVDWYKARSPTLAADFAVEVQRVLAAICAEPAIYGFVSANVRLARTKKFSYAIYFTVENNQIVVIAILHTARDPSIWERRLPG